MRKQHLCRVLAVALERGLVHLYQTHLPDGGHGLQLMQRVRALPAPESLHTRRHGTGRHQHHVDAAAAQRCHLRRPIGNAVHVQALAITRQQCAADLDDDTTSAR